MDSQLFSNLLKFLEKDQSSNPFEAPILLKLKINYFFICPPIRAQIGKLKKYFRFAPEHFFEDRRDKAHVPLSTTEIELNQHQYG